MYTDAIAYTLIMANRGPTKKQKCSLNKQNSREKDGYLTIEVMMLAAGTIPANENGPNGLTALRG